MKLKKEQLLEDRFTEIERENRLLLEKMSNIMISEKNSVGFIKNPTDKPTATKTSLNKEARKRELMRISLEN